VSIEAGEGFKADVVGDIQDGAVSSGQKRGGHLDSQSKKIFQRGHTEGLVKEPSEGGDTDPAAFGHIFDDKNPRSFVTTANLQKITSVQVSNGIVFVVMNAESGEGEFPVEVEV